ncbi:hypothetical protein [Methylobacter sp.]|uniref:hypothetical protein n=1 Tax=Methylobacter sp. TaxID=2051955 RepID=UPI002FDDE7BF
MKLHDLTRLPSSGFEGMLRRLLQVEEKDLSPKSIFDHFRNYLICASLISGGILISKTGSPLSLVLAVFLFLIAFGLLALNITHGLILVSALGIRRWLGIALGLIMFFVMGHVVVIVGLK